MRKITEESINAFFNAKNFKKANMRVENRGDEIFLYLHDNMIAHLNNLELFISTCGWESNTTKERLNGLLDKYGLGKIQQKAGKWLLNGESFNGTKIFKL
jgi:hypothetical protein